MHIWSLAVTMTIWLVFKHAPSKSLFSGSEAWLPRQPPRMYTEPWLFYLVFFLLLLHLTVPESQNNWGPRAQRLWGFLHHHLTITWVKLNHLPHLLCLKEVAQTGEQAHFAFQGWLPSAHLCASSSSTVQMILYGMLIAIT